MITAIRLGRIPPHLRLRSSPELRSRQVIGFATVPNRNSQNMDGSDQKNTTKEHGDIMSQSFGEGYASRSEEEGFGGTRAGNEPIDDDNKKPGIHENHPEYDRSQGSEVKEKENSRHQARANR